MESKEVKLCNNQTPRITTKNNLFWMDKSSSMEGIKKEHTKIILLGFITGESFNCKSLRTKIFEGGDYVMTQGDPDYFENDMKTEI
jgi:hypothetical protein